MFHLNVSIAAALLIATAKSIGLIRVKQHGCGLCIVFLIVDDLDKCGAQL